MPDPNLAECSIFYDDISDMKTIVEKLINEPQYLTELQVKAIKVASEYAVEKSSETLKEFLL